LHQVGRKKPGSFVGQVPFVPLEGHWKARGPAKGPEGGAVAQRRTMAPGEVYLGPPPPPREEEESSEEESSEEQSSEEEDQEESPEEQVGLDSSSLGALSPSSAPGKRRPGGQPGNRNRKNWKGGKGVPILAATKATKGSNGPQALDQQMLEKAEAVEVDVEEDEDGKFVCAKAACGRKFSTMELIYAHTKQARPNRRAPTNAFQRTRPN
jgi:hypothetical protein